MARRSTAQRTAVAFSCLVAFLSVLLFSSGSAAADSASRDGPSAFRILRGTMIAALGSLGAGHAIGTLGNSLALLDARYRVERSARVEARAEPEPDTELAVSDEEVDPSTLPPASAGTNGTHVPHRSSLDPKIVAHSRGAESNAILLSGIALAPPNVPEAIKNVINAANTIVGRPYVWGGGHQSFYSNGYDCSGSVSFALFGGGLIPRPLTSGELEHWGAPGPGKWITVFANAHHTFAEIAGLRWDTVGDALGTGPRWHLATASGGGFVVRHPPGY